MNNSNESKVKNSILKNEYVQAMIIMGISIFFVLVLMISVDSVMGTPVEEVTIVNNKAEKYYYEGRYDEAIAEYTEMQKEDPWPTYLIKIAEIYSMRGEFETSNGALKEAVIHRDSLISENKEEYLEKDKEFMNDVVFTFFMNKEYQQAITLGRDYLEEVGPYRELVETMFTIHVALGEEILAEEMVTLYPVRENNASDLAKVAKMQMIINDKTEGIATLKRAWDIDKNEVQIFDVITQIASYDEKAILEELLELVELNPNEDLYKLFIAKIYTAIPSKVVEAEGIINNIAVENTDNINYAIIKAQLYSETGREKEANKIIDKIISDENYDYIGYHIMAWNLYKDAEYEEAFEYCKKSIIEKRDYADNYGFLIPEIMKNWGQTQAVESYYRTALSIEPFNQAMMIKIADYYAFTTSQYEKAKEYYNIALALNPNEDFIYYQLGCLALIEEDVDVALENLNKAIELNNGVGQYYRTIGNVYLEQEQNDLAINSYRSAYALDNEDVLALNNAGAYYISVEENLFRGFDNIEGAYEKMNEDIDQETKEMITENYNNAKKLLDDYNKDNGVELDIPDFHLFY